MPLSAVAELSVRPGHQAVTASVCPGSHVRLLLSVETHQTPLCEEETHN